MKKQPRWIGASIGGDGSNPGGGGNNSAPITALIVLELAGVENVRMGTGLGWELGEISSGSLNGRGFTIVSYGDADFGQGYWQIMVEKRDTDSWPSFTVQPDGEQAATATQIRQDTSGPDDDIPVWFGMFDVGVFADGTVGQNVVIEITFDNDSPFPPAA